MKLHLEDCKKFKLIHGNLNEEEEDDEIQAISSVSGQPGVSQNSKTANQQSDAVTVKTQTGLKSFIDSISLDLKTAADEALARAAFATAIPLCTFQHPLWIKAFSILRPAYKPPTAYNLGGKLLQNEYERIMTETHQKINEAASLAIMTDSWTNIKGESIVNFMISTPKPMFLKSLKRENKETGEFIAFHLKEIINEVGKNKVILLVTDNASNMKAAWKIIKQKFPHIITIGCAAHSINLLLSDIMNLKSMNDLYLNVKKIIKSFKSGNKLITFKKNQDLKYGKEKGISLKLPSKTRWGGIVISLKSILTNEAALQATVIDKDLQIDGFVRQTVLDETFWAKARSALAILIPIAEAITYIESDSAYLSDILQIFSEINKVMDNSLSSAPLTENEQEQVRMFVARREEFCCKPVHKAVNILDPRYFGQVITDAAAIEAIDIIIQLAEHLKLDTSLVLSNLAEYRTKSGLWSRPQLCYSAQNIDPITWWQGLCTKQPLCPIAVQLLNLPPTSAGCEKNWSTFGRIHTRSRNKLLPNKVEMLVAINAFYSVKHQSGKKSRDPFVVRDLPLSSNSNENESNVETESDSDVENDE